MSSPNRNELADIDAIVTETLEAKPLPAEQETTKRKQPAEGAKNDDESSPDKRIKLEDNTKIKEEPSDNEAIALPIKTDPNPMAVPTKTEPGSSTSDGVKIKVEPVDGAAVPAAAHTSSAIKVEPADSGSTSPAVVVKTEPATSNGQTANNIPNVVSSSTTRNSCYFGIRCYRRNPLHRMAVAHPGDADYTRPNFPAPPLGTPSCPFGNLCYRRNPVHFQRMSHPPNFNSDQNIRNRLRQRQTHARQAGTTGDDEDSDEEEEDPFGGDNDDDLEYKPGADIDEDEDEDDELEFDSQRINADDYD
ncbi:GL13753 [Drosophila persimilis]|uniref:GL13753 n=2 Tax=Drosophila persimilis TaxID=7234 RepID=B4GNT6_DROPE|nr:aprataxin and PNK-like factor isoform X1 [Drosophila persimilis]EDW38819.1 GL13753 [Drosophila persimilis]